MDGQKNRRRGKKGEEGEGRSNKTGAKGEKDVDILYTKKNRVGKKVSSVIFISQNNKFCLRFRNIPVFTKNVSSIL